MDLERLVGQKLFLAFEGREGPSPEIAKAFQEFHPGGITLFRRFNVGTLSQLKELTTHLQRLAQNLDLPPLLIAIDQEGGQLMGVGDGTPLPGNMALGATRSKELSYRAGGVLGCELASLAINVNYAPCVDVNVNPQNPVVGVRSFGESPDLVAELAAAMIEGMQSRGVAATAKHFPGHGDTASDSHLGLPTVPHQLARLRSVEFPPFLSAIEAGAKLVMTAHLGVPSIDGQDAPPATLSEKIIRGLLRRDLGFDGVIITDAMDMHAIRQGKHLGEEAIRAVRAGVDILLLTKDPADHKRVHTSLMQAVRRKQLDLNEIGASVARIAKLKRWLAEQPFAPDLSVIQSTEHLFVAKEIAERSITLVRDRTHLIPLRLEPGQRLTVIVPEPHDLTPADTSSYIVPRLVQSLREYHPCVDEIVVPYAPGEGDIANVLEKVRGCDLILAGTINAFNQAGQAVLVNQLLKMNIPVIVAALRLPYDLVAFPQAPAYVCTYGILEPSMRALAKALFGQGGMQGRLPVSIPGLYEAG